MSDIKTIKSLIKNAFYCSISTITSDGNPHISPIGSVYLENEHGGYFIELFTKSMADKSGAKACIMAVNTSPLFWIKSLIKGKFISPPAIRLLVTLGDQRKITNIEMERFQKKVKMFKWTKGHKLMWSKASYVRPFKVEKVIPVSIGKMTKS
jgi:hypothetical protein